MRKIPAKYWGTLLTVFLAVVFLLFAIREPFDFAQSNLLALGCQGVIVSALAVAMYNAIKDAKGTDHLPVVFWFVVFLFIDVLLSAIGSASRLYYNSIHQLRFYTLEFQPRLSVFRLIAILEAAILILATTRRSPLRNALLFMNWALVGLTILYVFLHIPYQRAHS